LIFDARQGELRSLHSYATTSASSRSIPNVFAKGSSFLAPQIDIDLGTPQFSAAFRLSDA
jgi:hypothetical protein